VIKNDLLIAYSEDLTFHLWEEKLNVK